MTRRLRALARLGPVFACLLLAACGVAENMGLVDAEDPSAPPGIPYGVDIEGSMPDAVRSYLLAASDAAQATDRPPSSALVLRRRAEDDLDKLRRALRAAADFLRGAGPEMIDHQDRAGDDGPAEHRRNPAQGQQLRA